MFVLSSPPLFGFSLLFSHDLRHEIAHLFGCAFLHLACDVRVGAERESRVEMAEHTGHCFHVYAILKRQRCECVSQVVKSQVFQSRVLQDFLVNVHDRIRMVHLACFRRREHPGFSCECSRPNQDGTSRLFSETGTSRIFL